LFPSIYSTITAEGADSWVTGTGRSVKFAGRVATQGAADEFVEIETWKEWELVLDLSKVVVMMRPGYGLGEVERKFMGRFMRVQVPLINISSRNIRMRVKEGKSIRYLVLREVEEYIKQKGLYR